MNDSRLLNLIFQRNRHMVMPVLHRVRSGRQMEPLTFAPLLACPAGHRDLRLPRKGQRLGDGAAGMMWLVAHGKFT